MFPFLLLPLAILGIDWLDSWAILLTLVPPLFFSSRVAQIKPKEEDLFSWLQQTETNLEAVGFSLGFECRLAIVGGRSANDFFLLGVRFLSQGTLTTASLLFF